MKHEIKKIMKIADEVMTFCMYNYEAEHAEFSVHKRGEDYECAKRSWRTPSRQSRHDQRLTIRSELNYARRWATNCAKP